MNRYWYNQFDLLYHIRNWYNKYVAKNLETPADSELERLRLQPLGHDARISDAVHDQLRLAILAGRVEPGAALPSERRLSEAFGVNRHAIREALNRLQQAKLVAVTQGGATRVLDWRATGGLDLLLDLGALLVPGVEPRTLRSIVEMRACIGTDVARRCAERGSAKLRGAAAATADRIAAEADAGAREAANAELWERLVDGSDNVAYRLAMNSLMAGLTTTPQIASALAPTVADAADLRSLAAALRARDSGAAADAARKQLERPLTRLGRGPRAWD